MELHCYVILRDKLTHKNNCFQRYISLCTIDIFPVICNTIFLNRFISMSYSPCHIFVQWWICVFTSHLYKTKWWIDWYRYVFWLYILWMLWHHLNVWSSNNTPMWEDAHHWGRCTPVGVKTKNKPLLLLRMNKLLFSCTPVSHHWVIHSLMPTPPLCPSVQCIHPGC